MLRQDIVVITTAQLHSTKPELRFRLTFAMVKISAFLNVNVYVFILINLYNSLVHLLD